MLRAWRGRSHAFAVAVGKYDQIFTLGEKIKDGEVSIIDEKNLATMMDNFAARKNDLGMDYEHATATAIIAGNPAPQLAFYNALALIIGGKLIKFVTHDDSVAAPDPSSMTDGLFAHRARVTPLGEELLPNYAYVSPFFVMEDTDEFGNEIGPNLLNISAVSVPFQDGCAIQFSRFGASTPDNKGEIMNEEMKKALGLAKDASDEACMAALMTRLKKYDDEAAERAKQGEYSDDEKKEHEEAMKKMADDNDRFRKFLAQYDVDPENLPQNAAIHLKTGNVHDEGGRKSSKMGDGDGDEDDKKAMTAMRKELGLAEQAPPRAIYAAFAAKTAPLSLLGERDAKIAALTSKVDSLEGESIAKKAEMFVANAIRDGRTMKDKGQHLVAEFSKAERAQAGSGPKALEPQLYARGTFTLGKVFTDGKGQPLGKEAEISNLAQPDGEDVIAEFNRCALAISKSEKIAFSKAMMRVKVLHPEVYARYAALNSPSRR